jgi:hypothetical protein
VEGTHTLSRPTGPSDGLTMLATAPHAITAIKAIKQAKTVTKPVRSQMATRATRSHKPPHAPWNLVAREGWEQLPFCVRTSWPDWCSPRMSGVGAVIAMAGGVEVGGRPRVWPAWGDEEVSRGGRRWERKVWGSSGGGRRRLEGARPAHGFSDTDLPPNLHPTAVLHPHEHSCK